MCEQLVAATKTTSIFSSIGNSSKAGCESCQDNDNVCDGLKFKKYFQYS